MPARTRRRARAWAARRARPSRRRRARCGPCVTLSRCRDRRRAGYHRGPISRHCRAPPGRSDMRIDLVAMERMQSLHWHRVKYDLSESGVLPMTVQELLSTAGAGREPGFLATKLGYPLSEGSEELRELIARWYPGASAANVTVVNGGSEANHLALWSLLEPGGRLAFMVPNYLQGWGLGRHYAGTTDVFALRQEGKGKERRWALDLEQLEQVARRKPRVIMVCNPNNPTGAVLSEAEMDAVVDAARRARAWIVADEIYRGAEVAGGHPSPSFW